MLLSHRRECPSWQPAHHKGTRLPFEGGLTPGIDSMQGMRGRWTLSETVKGADVTWLGGELSLESGAPALESQLYSMAAVPEASS